LRKKGREGDRHQDEKHYRKRQTPRSEKTWKETDTKIAEERRHGRKQTPM
jgi:hypothetical protein